jgi:hypothetical protein
LGLELAAFVAVVGLLWGPTALWLLYRAVRGRNDQRIVSGPLGTNAEAGDAGPADLRRGLGLSDEDWVCGRCRSLNRSGASRCYSCGASASAGISVGSLGERPVPVMAPPVAATVVSVAAEPRVADESMAAVAANAAAGSPPGIPVAPASAATPQVSLAPAAVGGRRTRWTQTPSSAPPPPPPPAQPPAAPAPSAQQPSDPSSPSTQAGAGSSPPSGRRSRRRTKAAAAPAAAAIEAQAAPAASAGADAAPVEPSAIVRHAQSSDREAGTPAMPGLPAPMPPAAAPTGAMACPYLGLRDDRSTHFGFPHPGNACHAAVGSPTGWRRRIPFGGGRPQQVSPEQQSKLCLTADHLRCPVYPGRAETPPSGMSGTAG